MTTNESKEKPIKDETNWEAYRSDTPAKSWQVCLIVLGLFILFQQPVHTVVNTLFVQPFFKTCPQDFFADLVVLCFLLWAVIFGIRQYCKGLILSIGSIIIMATVTTLYLIFFRPNGFYDFYHFSFAKPIYYWDSALPALLLLTSTYRSYKKPLSIPVASKLTLIEDSPLSNSEDDIYEREAYASRIAQHIQATVTRDAFAIGVVGDWGSGKTQFLLRIKDALKEETQTIVVEFNPWRAGKPEAIIEDFFKTLSDRLKPYSRSVDQKIREYSKKILMVGKEVQYRIIDTLIGEWVGDSSVQKQYEEINAAIRSVGKRIVILIDDVDRLTGKEVMEVLRLIRNTANFSNTFFVVGIDQRYVVNVLRNTKDFAFEEEYLEKVFQLTITLPAFKKEILVDALKKQLATEDLDDARKKQIHAAVDKLTKNFDDVSIAYYPAANHDNVLEKMVDNIRDLKRFVNSFKIAMNAVGDEVDLHDLMVLELIRNKNINLYNKLRDRSMLGFNTNHATEFIIDDAEWQKFTESEGKSLPNGELDGLKQALDYMVMDIAYKTARKFQSVHNFYLYFSYQLFDLIPLGEFNKLREKSADEIVAQYDKWADDKKERELAAISNRLTDFASSADLLKMLEVYGRVKGNENEWLVVSNRLLFDLRKMNAHQYFNDEVKGHGDFLKRYFALNTVNVFFRARIADHFVKGFLDETIANETLVFGQEDWLKIMANLWKEYLTQLPKLEDRTLPFLAFNTQARLEDNFPIVSVKAAELFKDHLLTNRDSFIAYVKVLIRKKNGDRFIEQNPTGYYIFDPFLTQVFTEPYEFKSYLSSFFADDTDFEAAKDLVLKYLDIYLTKEKRPVLIDHLGDAEKISHLLRTYQNYRSLEDELI